VFGSFLLIPIEVAVGDPLDPLALKFLGIREVTDDEFEGFDPKASRAPVWPKQVVCHFVVKLVKDSVDVVFEEVVVGILGLDQGRQRPVTPPHRKWRSDILHTPTDVSYLPFSEETRTQAELKRILTYPSLIYELHERYR
jgi:hypothetical protein